jgi:hypothetical protein
VCNIIRSSIIIYIHHPAIDSNCPGASSECPPHLFIWIAKLPCSLWFCRILEVLRPCEKGGVVSVRTPDITRHTSHIYPSSTIKYRVPRVMIFICCMFRLIPVLIVVSEVQKNNGGTNKDICRSHLPPHRLFKGGVKGESRIVVSGTPSTPLMPSPRST